MHSRVASVRAYLAAVQGSGFTVVVFAVELLRDLTITLGNLIGILDRQVLSKLFEKLFTHGCKSFA
ncbi:hypothetical protein D3C76_1390850 [compost metagenome]